MYNGLSDHFNILFKSSDVVKLECLLRLDNVETLVVLAEAKFNRLEF